MLRKSELYYKAKVKLPDLKANAAKVKAVLASGKAFETLENLASYQ